MHFSSLSVHFFVVTTCRVFIVFAYWSQVQAYLLALVFLLWFPVHWIISVNSSHPNTSAMCLCWYCPSLPIQNGVDWKDYSKGHEYMRWLHAIFRAAESKCHWFGLTLHSCMNNARGRKMCFLDFWPPICLKSSLWYWPGTWHSITLLSPLPDRSVYQLSEIFRF